MIRTKVIGPSAQLRDAMRRGVISTMEADALQVTHRAGLGMVQGLRTQMQSAGLGRTGQAFGMVSDFQKGRVYRRADGRFSASAMVFPRTKSERTLGTLDAYLGTGTAVMRPRNASGLMWFPTEDIRRRAMLPSAGSKSGKASFRLTPKDWKRAGLDRKIGPLVRITAKDGTPLLVVNNVGVSAAGKRGSARSLRKNGMPRRGDVAAEQIIAFVGIPVTSRARRVDPDRIAQAALDSAARGHAGSGKG